MSGTKLNLMSFEPKPGVLTEVHTVALPPELRDALFALMPPRHGNACLPTAQLKGELRCWLDQAVELSPVRPDGPCDPWLVALKPVDLVRFCNVTANWVFCSVKKETRESAAYRKVMELLCPQTFKGHTMSRMVSLFDEDGRPSEEAKGLTFPAFSAQVANALVGRPFFLANGTQLVFNRLSAGTGNRYELVSDPLWFEDKYPYSVVLKFHVETTPNGRKTHLNLDISVRSFISEKWQGEPWMPKRVHAHVRTDDKTFRVMPYGYDKQNRHIEWGHLAKKNYEGANYAELPEIEDYLANIFAYARGNNGLQILSPMSTSTPWAKVSKVENGISMLDKAALFELVGKALADYVEPTEPVASSRLSHLKPLLDDTHVNRKRLALCTGEESITFEIIGTGADREYFDLVREEIVDLLGEEGDSGGLEITIAESLQDELLLALKSPGDAAIKSRWMSVEQTVGPARGLTACIVILPGKKHFEAGATDPKEALRMGLARSGRLSQFLLPGSEDGNIETRVKAAVRDLMRQLGFVPEFNEKRELDFCIPVTGLRVHESSRDRKDAKFPIAVTIIPQTGAVSVECPLLEDGPLPYWQAQLELARLSTSSNRYEKALRHVDGQSLKCMIDEMKRRSRRESLLLVQAYSRIRCPEWWPGISDSSLAGGELRYGPTKSPQGAHFRDELFELGDSKLAIMRIRSGADGEVPDYFTDSKNAAANTESPVPQLSNKQGLFPMDGYVLGLTARPFDPTYTWSFNRSKFDHPDQRFSQKKLNEYCLLTPGDADMQLALARYAEALRGGMVQLVNPSTHTDLPAPLHLAAHLDEYIWAPSKRSRR